MPRRKGTPRTFNSRRAGRGPRCPRLHAVASWHVGLRQSLLYHGDNRRGGPSAQTPTIGTAEVHRGLHKGRRNLRCTFCLSQCTRKAQERPSPPSPLPLRREALNPPAAFNTGRRKPAHASCSPHWTVVQIWPARLDRRVERRARTPGRCVIEPCSTDVQPCPNRSKRLRSRMCLRRP